MTREFEWRAEREANQGPGPWADQELRDARAQIIRLQHQVEQREAEAEELFNRVRQVEDGLVALGAELDRSREARSLLEQLREQVDGVQESQVALEQRLEDLSRRWQEEAERSRQIQNDLIKTLGQLDRAVQTWNARLESLEEANRRLHEVLAHHEQRIDGNDRQLESLEIRSARAVEASKRADQEFSRLGVELDALRAQDEALGERLHLFNEWLRHAENQMNHLQEQARLRQDIMDKLELQRVERQRLEDRVNEMSSFLEGVRERLDEQQRLMGLLDAKGQGLQSRLSTMQDQIQSHRQQVADLLTRLVQAQERQKRRQMEDLEREIRELQSYGFWPADK